MHCRELNTSLIFCFLLTRERNIFLILKLPNANLAAAVVLPPSGVGGARNTAQFQEEIIVCEKLFLDLLSQHFLPPGLLSSQQQQLAAEELRCHSPSPPKQDVDDTFKVNAAYVDTMNVF